MQMLRYMQMSTGPSEARRGFGSPIAGVRDSWEPSVILGTELGSSGKAVRALKHQVVSLAPGHGLFFCMPNLSFALQGMGQEASWMIIPDLCCLTCHQGFPWEKQRKTWGNASRNIIFQNWMAQGLSNFWNFPPDLSFVCFGHWSNILSSTSLSYRNLCLFHFCFE